MTRSISRRELRQRFCRAVAARSYQNPHEGTIGGYVFGVFFTATSAE